MWYKFSGKAKDVFFGHLIKEHGRHPDRILDYWVFGYIYSGDMKLRTGDEESSLKAGSFYILPPGVRHFGLDDKFNDVYWVHFKMPARTTTKLKHVDFKTILLP